MKDGCVHRPPAASELTVVTISALIYKCPGDARKLTLKNEVGVVFLSLLVQPRGGAGRGKHQYRVEPRK